MTERRRHSRLSAALLAGAIAIAVNTALLAAADAIQFTTARGGLLRLVKDLLQVSAPTGPAVQMVFHIVVGLLMAIFYAYVLERRLPRHALLKGFIYAAGVWVLNAFVVLPLIGEGIAGSRYLGPAGILGFAVIHTVFFVLLALLYARYQIVGLGLRSSKPR